MADRTLERILSNIYKYNNYSKNCTQETVERCRRQAMASPVDGLMYSNGFANSILLL